MGNKNDNSAKPQAEPCKAILQYSNGELYDGEVIDGVRNGAGTYNYQNGDKFEGKWFKNMKHGKGSFFYNKTGEVYEGMWHNNKKEGVGTFYSKNGDRYYGEWRDNKRHGKGIVYMEDGSKFVGEFKFNKKCGIAELVNKSGDVIYEEWQDGKLIRQHEKFRHVPGLKQEIDYNELNTNKFEQYLEAKTKQQYEVKTNQMKSKYFTLEIAKLLKSKNPENFYDSVRVLQSTNNIVMEKPDVTQWTTEDIANLLKKLGYGDYIDKIYQHQIDGYRLINTSMKELSALLCIHDRTEITSLSKHIEVLKNLKMQKINYPSMSKENIEEEVMNKSDEEGEEGLEERKERGDENKNENANDNEKDNKVIQIHDQNIQDEINKEMHMNNLNFVQELTAPSRKFYSSVNLNGLNYFINYNEIITEKNKIGEGGFGEVYLGEWHGKKVAIKKLTVKSSQFIDNLNKFINEINIISSLRHPSIVLYMGASINMDDYYMITEYLPRGSLFDYIHKDHGKITEREQMSIAYEIAVAIKYLHSRNVIHCDLKSSNILIDDNWKIKIGDFGLSRFLKKDNSEENRGRIGTPHWMAPEILRGEKYEFTADVFSYGMILWELLSHEVPYYGINPYQVINLVAYQKKIVQVPKEGNMVLRKIIERCLEYEPGNRPKLDEIVQLLEKVRSIDQEYDESMMDLYEYLN